MDNNQMGTVEEITREFFHCEADNDDVFHDDRNPENNFDLVVGHLEDILIDSDFQKLQKDFLDKYWTEFEDTEENKLEYMEIFDAYVDVVEKNIENRLKMNIPNFNMENFLDELSKNKNLDGEVFELLYTLSDFTAFKELMLDHRMEKEGRCIDFSQDIRVTPIKEPC